MLRRNKPKSCQKCKQNICYGQNEQYLAYAHVYADSNTPKDEIRDENNFEVASHIHTFDSIHLTFQKHERFMY